MPAQSVWFLAGVVATLLIEGVFAGGLFYAAPEPQPATDAPAQVERRMVFRVLVPKGFEDASWVGLDCKPSLELKNDLHGRRR